MNAVTKTATAIFSGKTSMALAKLNPPKLWPTSTTFSPSATEAIKSIRGWAYSSKVETSSGILRGSEPQAARSTAVTEYPCDLNMATTLYQHQAPWPPP
ncbi:hypothetical protein M5K25_020145 [Dendrobium thyrsiflorum]|uniref:Uncharacterized protein n=1 Tax=Dendrobium thyrsiflorum TaxID=117978 RepID=A0ABD0UFZ5_DENTH